MVEPNRSSLDDPRVFAVEDDAVQITWGRVAPGTLSFALDDHVHEVTTGAAGGTLSIGGLGPDRPYEVVVRGEALRDHPNATVTLAFRTLAPPPGPELFRLATMSDLHIGIDHFDLRHRMLEVVPPGADPHPVRCARAALRESLAWGAQRIVLKGDLTEQAQPDQWDALGRLLGDLPVPLDVMTGNHDRKAVADNLPAPAGAARAGLPLRDTVDHVDLPGIRLVFADTVVPGRRFGRIPAGRTDAVADVVGASTTPCLIFLHHHLESSPIPWFLPIGVPAHQTRRFLDAVAAANPRALVTSGHTHRNRSRRVGPLAVTEVGSPKDYPGTWAGYVVHEGGVRQVVRRVEAPECVDWLERTRGAAFGSWGRWSPGTLEQRCFTHPWPS